MRKSLQFDLDTGSAKPVIVSSMNADLTFLVDTGADTPVRCRGEEELLDLFPETSRLEYRYLLSGFGTGVEVVDAFCIPEFCLSDGVETITYSNFVVAAADRPSIGCDLILPASIFNHAMMSGSKVPCDEIACALCTEIRRNERARSHGYLCKGHNAASGM